MNIRALPTPGLAPPVRAGHSTEAAQRFARMWRTLTNGPSVPPQTTISAQPPFSPHSPAAGGLRLLLACGARTARWPLPKVKAATALIPVLASPTPRASSRLITALRSNDRVCMQSKQFSKTRAPGTARLANSKAGDGLHEVA